MNYSATLTYSHQTEPHISSAVVSCLFLQKINRLYGDQRSGGAPVRSIKMTVGKREDVSLHRQTE